MIWKQFAWPGYFRKITSHFEFQFSLFPTSRKYIGKWGWACSVLTAIATKGLLSFYSTLCVPGSSYSEMAGRLRRHGLCLAGPEPMYIPKHWQFQHFHKPSIRYMRSLRFLIHHTLAIKEGGPYFLSTIFPLSVPQHSLATMIG